MTNQNGKPPPVEYIALIAMYGCMACGVIGLVVGILGDNGYLP